MGKKTKAGNTCWAIVWKYKRSIRQETEKRMEAKAVNTMRTDFQKKLKIQWGQTT